MYGGDSTTGSSLLSRGYGYGGRVGGFGGGYAGGSIEAEIVLSRIEATRCCCQPCTDPKPKPKPKPEFDSGPAIPRGNFIERLKIKIYLFFFNMEARRK